MDENLQIVLQILNGALSNNDDIRKPAISKIIEFRKQSGFCEILIQIITLDIQENIRKFAAVELKNTIKESWNKFTQPTYIIPDDEKERIKSKILNVIETSSFNIIDYLSLSISYIIQSDYPKVDSNIFNNIIQSIVSTFSSNQTQLCFKYLSILKESVILLCSLKKLKEYDEYDPDSLITIEYNEKTKYFKKEVTKIIKSIAPIWNHSIEQCVQSLKIYSQNPSSSRMFDESMLSPSIALLSFKMISHIFEKFSVIVYNDDKSYFHSIINEVISKYEIFLDALKSLPYDNESSKYLYKITKNLCKFIIISQERTPILFSQYLERSLSIYLKDYEQFNDSLRGDPFYDKIIIYTLNFLTNIFKCDEYKLPIEKIKETMTRRSRHIVDIEPFDEKLILHAKDILKKIMTNDYLLNLLHILIGTYLKLSENHLERWEMDPEDFIHEEISESYQNTITASAEHLFYRMMAYNSDLISNEVMVLIQKTYNNCNRPPQEVSIHDILLKDACYASLVLGYNTLSEHINFNDIFTLIKNDLNVNDPRYKLIRKRIAMIISQWVVDIPQEMHKASFQVLVSLMYDSDLIVRLNTLVAIINLLSEIDFDYEPYSDCIRPSLEAIINLIGDVKDLRVIKHVLELISKYIIYLKHRISPYVNVIIQSMSNLWSFCDTKEKNILKGSIINILSSLTESLPDHRSIRSTLIQICDISTDITKPDTSSYLEEGLKLWYNIIQQSDNFSEDVIGLYPRLSHIYNKYYDDKNITSITIRILETYIIVGEMNFLNMYGEDVISLFYRLIESGKSFISSINESLVTFIQMFPNDAPQPLYEVLKSCFKILITTRKTRDSISCCDLFMTIAAYNISFFIDFFNNSSLIENQNINPMVKIMEIFIDNFRRLDYIQPEKLWLYGFSQILASICSNYPQFISDILDACVALLLTIDEQECSSRRNKYKERKGIVMIKGSPAEVKRSLLKKQGPKYMDLKDLEGHFFIKLRETNQIIGGEQLYQKIQSSEEQTRKFLNKRYQCQ